MCVCSTRESGVRAAAGARLELGARAHATAASLSTCNRRNSVTVSDTTRAVDAHDERARIDLDAPDPLRGLAFGAVAVGVEPAIDRLHAQEQLAQAEGLDDVVVGAELERGDAIVFARCAR